MLLLDATSAGQTIPRFGLAYLWPLLNITTYLPDPVDR